MEWSIPWSWIGIAPNSFVFEQILKLDPLIEEIGWIFEMMEFLNWVSQTGLKLLLMVFV